MCGSRGLHSCWLHTSAEPQMCPHATNVSHSLSLHQMQTPFTMAAVGATNGKPWAVRVPMQHAAQSALTSSHIYGRPPAPSTTLLPTCLRVALSARSIRVRRPAWAWHLGAALQEGVAACDQRQGGGSGGGRAPAARRRHLAASRRTDARTTYRLPGNCARREGDRKRTIQRTASEQGPGRAGARCGAFLTLSMRHMIHQQRRSEQRRCSGQHGRLRTLGARGPQPSVTLGAGSRLRIEAVDQAGLAAPGRSPSQVRSAGPQHAWQRRRMSSL